MKRKAVVRRAGRPSPFEGDKEAIVERICKGLENGIPLTSLCEPEELPSPSTVYLWCEKDAQIAGAIARARHVGFDAIAEDALRIADTPQEGVETTTEEDGSVSEKRGDMLGHRKLQIETRLKLLAKWDPKRYGDTDKTTVNVGVAVNNITVSETERAELMARKRAAAERARLAEG